MSDVITTIMKELDSDPMISSSGILLDLESHGVFRKHRTLHVRGAVHSREQAGKALEIARRHAGADCDVVDHLIVK